MPFGIFEADMSIGPEDLEITTIDNSPGQVEWNLPEKKHHFPTGA